MTHIEDKFNLNLFPRIFGGNRVSRKKLHRFYLDLGSLLRSQLDLLSSVTIAAGNLNLEAKAVRQIQEGLKKGIPLSAVLGRQGLISTYDSTVISAGERSGKLWEVLIILGNYHGKSIDQRRQLINALSYPAIVLFTLIIVLYFLFQFMVPMFEKSFAMEERELPPLTSMIISSSRMFKAIIPWFGLFFLIGCTFIYLQRDNSYLKEIRAKVLLKVPVIGAIIHTAGLMQFCSLMQLFLSASLPLNEALKLSGSLVRLYPLQQAIRIGERKIIAGSSLGKALKPFMIIPRYLVLKINAAEEVNRLEHCFKEISEQLTEELNYRNAVLKNVLEPALIIIVGLVCGLVVIGMYLPLVEMNTISP